MNSAVEGRKEGNWTEIVRSYRGAEADVDYVLMLVLPTLPTKTTSTAAKLENRGLSQLVCHCELRIHGEH